MKVKVGFWKNLLGNQLNGKFEYSLKKQLLLLASLISYTLPHVLLYQGKITGDNWTTFMVTLVSVTMGLYGAGKWIDRKGIENENTPSNHTIVD